MRRIQSLLVPIASFLLIWFYAQPFAKDVDQIIDDAIYTQEEKEYDYIRYKRINEVNAEMLKLKIQTDSINHYMDSIYKTLK